jgi:hypothetical protein
MPKEYLFPERDTGNALYLSGSAEYGVEVHPRAVKLIWNKVGYVQIATVTRADQPRPQVEGQPRTDDGLVDDGQHLELSRADVNTLIRTLRRARDQAFGRDE